MIQSASLKYKIISLVIVSIIITNVWWFIDIDYTWKPVFQLFEKEVLLPIDWFIKILTFNLQGLLLLVALYLGITNKTIRYILEVSTLYQVCIISDYFLTFNYYDTYLTIFAVVVASLILILTKWRR